MDFVYNALNWVGWATAVFFLMAGGYLAAGAFAEWWDRRPRGTEHAEDRKVPRNAKKARAREKAATEVAPTDEGDVSIATDTVERTNGKGKVAN